MTRSGKRGAPPAPSDSSLPPRDDPEEVPFSITLRDVEIAPQPDTTDLTEHEELVQSDAEARREPWLGDPQAERDEQRAARRAQVRRDRARDAQDAAPAPTTPEVLVLGADARTDTPLCELLHAFGFAVRAATNLPESAAPWPFVVVFVDVTRGTAGGGDAIELCNEVRERSRLPGALKPAIMLVADRLGSIERVRAGLAGCNEILLGPLTRGHVARALEARAIALPSDARRG
jgi:CheY-like chemotaxis protein